MNSNKTPTQISSFLARDFLISLASIRQLGNRTLSRIYDWLATKNSTQINKLWKTSASSWPGSFRLSLNMQTAIDNAKKDCSIGQIRIDQESKNISHLLLGDELFPNLLAQIDTPPVVLFVSGQLPNTNRSVAVVGSRKISAYGRQVTAAIVSNLDTNTTLISGGMFGVDLAAHTAALNSGLKSIAVLGYGIGRLYPYKVARQLNELIDRGLCLVSEYPPGAPPQKFQFVARNRIVAGLAQTVVIVEAAQKSGSLITAEFGLDYGREVMAVPGSIFSDLSVGCNELIEQGAKPYMLNVDVLSSWHSSFENNPKQKNDEKKCSTLQNKIIQKLKKEPIKRSELANIFQEEIPQILVAISLLETQNIISISLDEIYLNTK